jgi:peptidoglycan hydrolase-like protein with peptidoglycan-binding domain
MSCSKWAWTEGCAPVGVVACGVGERAGRGSLLGAVSSTKRLVRLMAASVLVIGVAPAPALAGSASGSHVKTPTPNKQYSTHVDRASAVVLALGSGYSSRGGAARVRALQRRLAGAGFAPGPIDGRYGPRTEQAVRSFQAARGLGVDGIAGPLTLAALSRPSVALYPGAGYAGRGSARVRVLQRRLAGAGFASGPIDGRYGPRTEQAVRSFQAAHGLGVDGIAGAQILAYLGNRQPTTPHQATQPSRPAGSHRPAIRSSRPAPPRKIVPAIRSTGSPSIGLLVLLIALAVALGLSATWLARRRHNRRYADADAGVNRAPRSDPADATVVHPNLTPNQTTTPASAITPSPDPGGPDDADGAFTHALLLEKHGDEMGAMAAYQRADGLGHGAAAVNLGVLLEQHGDRTAAEASYRRADQRGDASGAYNLAILLEEQGDHIGALRAYQRAEQLGHPEIADMARAAALDLRRQSESPIAVGQGGGHDGP